MCCRFGATIEDLKILDRLLKNGYNRRATPTNHLSKKRTDWDFLPRENVCPVGIDFDFFSFSLQTIRRLHGVLCEEFQLTQSSHKVSKRLTHIFFPVS
jgi:hypothetical protein